MPYNNTVAEEIETSKTKAIRTLYIVLLSVTASLVLLLIIGTVVGLARSPSSPPLITFGKDKGAPPSVLSEIGDIRVFSGIGRLRIPLSDSSTMILSISFPYMADDTVFTEELAAKIGDFKNIATDYFTSLPKEKLTPLDEDTAKAEILRRFNENLRLGRIEALYFNDLMVID
jgi:flagellar basal body-associated protein FliL